MLSRILIILGGLTAFLFALSTAGFLMRHELLRIYEDLPPFTHPGGETSETVVEMRDGIKLATIIYEPAGPGPWPTVLIRNPYVQMGPIIGTWCDRLVRYGYACVLQDVRGQGESEGDWEPVINERRDGGDTLRWLAKQPFMNGNIGMIGPSYLAAVQWAAAADTLPPEVKTFIPTVFSTNTHDTLYEDGMFRHESFTAWAALMAKPGEMGGGESGAQYQAAIRHRPHFEVDEKIFGESLPWYRDWISNPAPSDALWQGEDNRRLLAAPEQLEIPILMVGGWYDAFFGPQYDDWVRLASQSSSRFVIGPWTHIGGGGEALETPNSGGGLLQWKISLDWLGHHLKGEPLENGPGVATYVMRENRWEERRSWPPKGHRERLYLAGGDGALSCGGGRLQRRVPDSADRADYIYDPDNPVPTRGGSGMLAFVLPDFEGAPPATVWQEGLCDREDVLSFQTPVLKESIHLAGEIEVALTIMSDAADTAFTAKLVEVLSDGRAVNIRDGITSLAYRNGATAPQAHEPATPVEILIRFWPIEWSVPAGSSLRLNISSSDFPKYHAHPNQFGIWSQQTEARLARQSLIMGAGVATWIELPVAGP